MVLFWCNTTENFIFLLKYHQRKADLNANETSLVFITIRHRILHLYAQLSYTKISYLRKNTHFRKDAAFLHFRLKESSENMIFQWNKRIRKLTKNWSFLSFSQIFVRQKKSFHAVRYSMNGLIILRKSSPHYEFWMQKCTLRSWLF